MHFDTRIATVFYRLAWVCLFPLLADIGDNFQSLQVMSSSSFREPKCNSRWLLRGTTWKQFNRCVSGGDQGVRGQRSSLLEWNRIELWRSRSVSGKPRV